MALRAIQEFVIHFQSFRNIDLWYQGAYLLRMQLYIDAPIEKDRIYAHPFAFTENYIQGEEQQHNNDTQVVKPAFIHNESSSFLSKAFLLRFYEEEVELNDICHFRIETDISKYDQEFVLQINLLFFDQMVKRLDVNQISVQKGKHVKTKKYIIKQSKTGVHEYIQAIFDSQYYSIANLMIHSVCLDYRFRLNKLQLFQFSRMTPMEKKKLLERNKKMQSKDISFLTTIAAQIKVTPNMSALQAIEDIIIKDMKTCYHNLLKEYSTLFSRVITDYHKKTFPQFIVHPGQLGLFEDETFSKANTWQEKLCKRYKSISQEEIIEKMLNETNLISAELIKLWHHFIDLVKMSPRFTVAHYQTIYLEQMHTYWTKYRKQELEETKDICLSSAKNDEMQDKLQKELISERQKSTLEFNIFNQEWINKKSIFPVMIENVYAIPQKKHQEKLFIEEEIITPKTDISLHLVVLVHGFQGNSLDMKMIKNNISALYPETSFLCATSNEEMTDTDIIEMGNRLATEIKSHILEYYPPDTLQRISFIGHSLGGVIIRAALPRLLDLKDKFHTFMTFSSPHLGYKVNASSVIEAGIWVLQKFKNSNCLKQLTMHDKQNPRETCLYKISTFQGVQHFKNIFLFSSKQDSYAPYESARIEIHPDFMLNKDPLKEVHCQMVRNILSKVKEPQLNRIRVNFTIQQTNIDSIIGRTAHILFLQNAELIQMFLHTHPRLFE